MPQDLPNLSRFELQCLRMLWDRGEASAKDIHEALAEPPSYSTIRTIFQRLEDKSAVERVGKNGRAVLYRPLVSRRAMVGKEVTRFIDTLFDGAAAPLVAHLADIRALDLDDLRKLERSLNEATDSTSPAPHDEESR